MADLFELENRLKQNRTILENVIKDMDDIQKEIDEIKKVSYQSDQSDNISNPTPVIRPQDIEQQPTYVQQQPIQQSPYVQQQPIQQPMQQPKPPYVQQHMQQPKPPYVQQPTQQPNPYVQQQIQRPVQERPNVKAVFKKADTESLFGKNIMGIAASILIFISFILFATLLIPKLTDGIKITLMLAVSIGITAVGLYKWFKNKESIFFLSLGACGVGAIYISLFLCNSYFHIIDDIVLYLLILIWAAGVLFLSRYKHRLFEVIGNLGILVSVYFGSILCFKRHDETMLLILSIYFVIGTLAFFIFRLKDNISHIICSAFNMIGMISILIAIYDVNPLDKNLSPSLMPAAIIMVLYAGAMVVINLLMTNDKNKEYIPIVGMLYTCILFPAIYVTFSNVPSTDVIGLIVATAIYGAIEYLSRKTTRFEKKGVVHYIWQSGLVIYAIINILDFDPVNTTVGVFILAVPLIIYGFLTDDILSKILSMVCFGIVAVDVLIEPVSFIVMVTVTFIMINVLMYFRKNSYHVGYKIASYLIFLLGIIVALILFADEANYENVETYLLLILIIPSIINFAANKTIYGKSWLTHDEEPSMIICCYVVNGCLMFYALTVVCIVEDPVIHFIAVLATVALFFINSISLLKKENVFLNLYVGIKFTILLITILCSYSVPNYVLSVATFILAIVTIIVGFVVDKKSLRLYGLVISLICVVKLVMIDITYDNTMGHALSFFISGILCFAISALYSIAEKRLHNEQ